MDDSDGDDAKGEEAPTHTFDDDSEDDIHLIPSN